MFLLPWYLPHFWEILHQIWTQYFKWSYLHGIYLIFGRFCIKIGHKILNNPTPSYLPYFCEILYWIWMQVLHLTNSLEICLFLGMLCSIQKMGNFCILQMPWKFAYFWVHYVAPKNWASYILYKSPGNLPIFVYVCNVATKNQASSIPY